MSHDLPLPQATDQSIVEEVLQMVLEITNSCLTHNLHNNPHLVYSLLYQREVFEPYRSYPSLMDLVQNIETVCYAWCSLLRRLHMKLGCLYCHHFRKRKKASG